MKIVERAYVESDRRALLDAGLHPVLARVYAGRRIRTASELSYGLDGLISPQALKGVDAAARLLADAIEQQKRLLIVADYDADGATACAVGMRALRAFGARVEYLVPDRFKLGYGLTPELVDVAAAERKPDLLITVDNGIASVEGVARAKALGIDTLITDHHLPGPELPAAACIVNPNQPGCDFPSKALAGCGVMFYVMLALRAELRVEEAFREHQRTQPGGAHRPGRPRHHRRRGAARREQPQPGGAGPEAPARRARRAGHRGAAARRRPPGSRTRRASTSASSPARASTPPAGSPT